MYDALDRFNRLIISRWVKNPPGGADRYKVTLSYVRNSNITEIDDAVQSGLDWQYTYDDLDRLTRARAGTLSGGGGSITSETRDQNWTLDHAGNWGHTTFDLNADDVYTGGGEYDWDFTQNKANEITGWDNQSPGGNVTPVYDAAGNMTDAKRDWQYEYDAWYRLVRVRAQNGSGGDIVAEFKYNGLGHRISARYPSGGRDCPVVPLRLRRAVAHGGDVRRRCGDGCADRAVLAPQRRSVGLWGIVLHRRCGAARPGHGRGGRGYPR